MYICTYSVLPNYLLNYSFLKRMFQLKHFLSYFSFLSYCGELSSGIYDLLLRIVVTRMLKQSLSQGSI